MTKRLGVAARPLHHHHNLEVNSPYYDVSEATGCPKARTDKYDMLGTRGFRATLSRVCQQAVGQIKMINRR